MSQSQPRLKTSAMIASIADEGQATVPAPFGVALSKLAAQCSAAICFALKRIKKCTT